MEAAAEGDMDFVGREDTLQSEGEQTLPFQPACPAILSLRLMHAFSALKRHPVVDDIRPGQRKALPGNRSRPYGQYRQSEKTL